MKENWILWPLGRQKYVKRCFLGMRLTMYLLLLGTLHLAANTYSQNSGVSLNMHNVSLREVVEKLQKVTDYTFLYKNDLLKTGDRLDVNVKDREIREVLDEILSPRGLAFEIDDKVIVIRQQNSAQQQVEEIRIQGKVVDEKRISLPGVTVLVKGTDLGVTTDEQGKFQLRLPKSSQEVVLVFSFVGMKKKEVSWKGEAELKVVMTVEAAEMEEVVVTGIFERKKESFTGSASTFKGEQLKMVSNQNILSGLRSLDPAFAIIENNQYGSDPNRLPDIEIRGKSSIVGFKETFGEDPNQPLFILDGFETTLQTVMDLSMDRVASLTILKDAASTAIYGAKAANGVIVIETKTPEKGKLRLSYNGNFDVTMADLSDYNLMNAREKLEFEKLARKNEYSNSITAEKDKEYRYAWIEAEIERGVDTYWLSEPLRVGFNHRHNLYAEGGDGQMRYGLGLSYNNTQGVMKGSGKEIVSGNIDLLYRVKNLIFSNKFSMDYRTNENPAVLFSEYAAANPYYRKRNENGEVEKWLENTRYSPTAGYENIGESPVGNPLYNATLNTKNRTTSFSVRNLFSVEYNPNSDLRLIGSFSLSKGNGKTDVFRPAQHTAFEGIADPTKRGDFRRTQQENFQYSLDLTASYNKLLGEVHYVTANARMSVQESKDESYGAHVTGFPNENMDEILFGKEYDEKMTGSENTSRLIGWAGSFGYSYAYKYSADFSIRLDGSSQFGKDNRFAPFWAAGVRWDVKKENFMSRVDFISEFVLRASYGVTGTQGFAPYQSRELYSYGALLHPYLASDGTGVELVAMPNEKLKWQQTDTWNIGLELGLLNGRITARAEYFQKLTKNSLTQITLAPSLGFNSYPENMGTLENKGVELNFAFIPYQNTAKSAYWTISLNGSHNTDKLKKISEALRHMNEENYNKQEDSPLPHYEEGESINRIWAVRSLGIDPMTGEEILLKRNGKMTGEYDVVDLVPCGTTEPKWQGNINSSFAYKGFGVDVSMAYKFGGQVYNQTLVDKVENADLMRNADKRVLDLRWMKVGDTAKFKGMNTGINGAGTKATSRFVMDENTFQMTSIALSYRMDRTNTKFLERWGLSSVKFAFNMEDLFYLSSVKQERGTDYPFARRFSFSLNVAF